MTSSSPTTIVALYRVRPEQKDQWLETWHHLSKIARSMPECRAFVLELDPNESDRCRVISTWSSGWAFDRFVRDVGLTWIERQLDYSRVPPHYTRLALPNAELIKADKRQPIHAGA